MSLPPYDDVDGTMYSNTFVHDTQISEAVTGRLQDRVEVSDTVGPEVTRLLDQE